MFLLDSLLIDGIRFVLDKLMNVAEAELKDDTVLRERLLDAQMRLELGELTGEEFAGIERDVFDRLRELRGAQPAALTMMSSGAKVSVEATVAEEVENAAAAETVGAPRGRPARRRRARTISA